MVELLNQAPVGARWRHSTRWGRWLSNPTSARLPRATAATWRRRWQQESSPRWAALESTHGCWGILNQRGLISRSGRGRPPRRSSKSGTVARADHRSHRRLPDKARAKGVSDPRIVGAPRIGTLRNHLDPRHQANARTAQPGRAAVLPGSAPRLPRP